ncbi:MAG: type I DNA topoisomerase [Lachnospiraceae bacterium]|jgi:DNA topoisomerase-1|nr:type I DNA topoisomerase [Lachnospiraceae bacterium]MEE3460461.1 type I DNA topoisomerase [Lachnospiraceae bacterium]
MKNNLIIVESPSKAATIGKFLGKNYTVIASNGHVRDLPRSSLGIDIDNDYEPKYITIRGKGELLAQLRKEVKKADIVYLATDPDREGEAISWHLSIALKLTEGKEFRRITFNEITKNAVKQALKNGRDIDMDLVDAQQARRVLDRLVGYGISPVLWAKVKRGLSAGRVQSVALRIVCDRENEINNFVPKEYFTIEGEFSEAKGHDFKAEFYGAPDKKIEIDDEKDADNILADLKKSTFKITDIKIKEKTRKGPLPFTTSTLQQEASKTLNFSTQKTMRVAQSLYEGVKIKDRGTIGLITYLRTDSIRISDEAKAMAHDYILDRFGADNLPGSDDKKKSAPKTQSKIQDAHEAIRPTYIDLDPAQVKGQLGRDEFRLYQLIWKRFTASQMADARFETKKVYIDSDKYRFTLSSSKNIFMGYLNVYKEDNEEVSDKIPKDLKVGMSLKGEGFEKTNHFTAPPAHFTEAALVRTLEELGIGRPSTYAPTISTILNRHYVVKEKKNIFVTELGEAVNSIMKKSFPSIVDVNFTATMEGLLDGVENGQVRWKTVIENFYPDLDSAVKQANEELEHVEIADEETDEICDKCGRHMVIKYGPYGKFLACPGFPECRNTKPYFEKTGIPCPVCGREIVIKKTKKGRRYYGCSAFPDCQFMSWQKPARTKCPECGSPMVIKGNKLVCTNPECVYSRTMTDEDKKSEEAG